MYVAYAVIVSESLFLSMQSSALTFCLLCVVLALCGVWDPGKPALSMHAHQGNLEQG